MSPLLLVAVPVPASGGHLILNIPPWVVNDKFRIVVSWVMLGVFAWGSVELWLSMGVALWQGRQFHGATALLVLGSILPYLRGRAFYVRLKNPAVKGLERLRLGCLVALMLGVNLCANIVCAVWASYNHVSGKIPFTWWDWVPLTIGAAAAIVIWMLKQKGVISPWAVLFNLAVFERITPMAVIAFCAVFMPVPIQMPLDAAEGMFKIGFQAFVLVVLERVNDWRKREQNELSPGEFRQGWWGFSADLCNLVACICLLVAL